MNPRYVTDEPGSAERYEIYTMCECSACEGAGSGQMWGGGAPTGPKVRCPECRGEGRTKILLATTGTAEGIGTIIVTLGREGELADCPIGILDTEGEKGQKWLVRPWQASTRNVSDAARVLAKSKKEKTT